MHVLHRSTSSRPSWRTAGLEHQIRSLNLPPRTPVLELDGRRCTGLDPEALARLRRAHHRFAANGRAIVVQHVTPELRRQLIEAGLAALVPASIDRRATASPSP